MLRLGISRARPEAPGLGLRTTGVRSPERVPREGMVPRPEPFAGARGREAAAAAVRAWQGFPDTMAEQHACHAPASPTASCLCVATARERCRHFMN